MTIMITCFNMFTFLLRATPISYVQKTYTIFKSTTNFLKRFFLDLKEVKSACIFNQVNNNIYKIQL